MSTTLGNPPPSPSPPTPASVLTQTRSFVNPSNTTVQRSNTAADGEVFARKLSSLEQRVETDGLPEDKGSAAYTTDEQSVQQSRTPPRTESNSQGDSGDESNASAEPENTDGLASWSSSVANSAGLTTGIVAGSGLLVSMAGGEASLQGALSATSVATLLDNLQARSVAAGTAMTFRLVDSGFGLTSMQLARHANGAWQIQLNAERSSRDNMKRYLDDLESGLIARGHSIDRIVLLDGSVKDG